MNAVRRFFSMVRDSPTYGRDRANLVTGLTIGTAGLLLNFVVLMLILPLMIDPDDRDFQALTQNLEFGQLLALALLGGATGFATLLIPLRLTTVFWGPRIGRYFDQIVLSGITPLRFVIGKAMSQNLFLGLILFLLLPYFVLSLALGGLDPLGFLAGLFLVWLYCMMLSMLMLWASLYFNEALADWLVFAGATIMSVLGCMPMPVQPFVLTPFPVLVHPILASLPWLDAWDLPARLPLFIASVLAMSAVIGIALCAIHLGPLFGIIRENSTFGEVVRAGDSKRKRWLRLRLHIQRPSELAFFYENRADRAPRHEGLIRWGAGFLALVALAGAAYGLMAHFLSPVPAAQRGGQMQMWIYGFHTMYLVFHGVGLVLACFLFSHSKNTALLRIPFVAGRRVQVSRLDTVAWLSFMLLSTAAAMSTPFLFERYVAGPAGNSVFPALMYATQGRPIDYRRIAIEGPLVLSTGGLVLYAIYRSGCLLAWLRSVVFFGVGGLYFFLFCMAPAFIGMLFIEVEWLHRFTWFTSMAPHIAMMSPIIVIGNLFEELGPRFPQEVTSLPFYIVHGLVLAWALRSNRRRTRTLREEYFGSATGENV